jgi:hypothetical protein
MAPLSSLMAHFLTKLLVFVFSDLLPPLLDYASHPKCLHVKGLPQKAFNYTRFPAPGQAAWPALIHHPIMICVVAFDRSSVRCMDSYDLPRRSSAPRISCLLVIREPPILSDPILLSTMRRWIWTGLIRIGGHGLR